MGKRHTYLEQMKSMMPYGITGLERVNNVTLQVSGHIRGSVTYQYSKSNTGRCSLFSYPLYSMEQVSLPTLSDATLTQIQDEVFSP